MRKFSFVFFVSLIFSASSYSMEGIQKDFELTQNDSIDMRDFQNYKIVFIGGIFNDVFLKVAGKISWFNRLFNSDILDAFRTQKAFFSYHGVENQYLDLNSEKSCSYNANQIVRYLSRQEKPVLLMAHSKGGLEVMEALVKHPEIREKVKGLITLQTPYYGTPLIEAAYENIPFGHKFVEIVMNLLKGEREAIDCMKLVNRQKFLSDNKEAIEEVLYQIPTIMMTSFEKLPSFIWENERDLISKIDIGLGLLTPFNRFLAQRGSPLNDGLVPTASMCTHKDLCMPVAEEMDHAGPIMDLNPFKSVGRDKRVNFTKKVFGRLIQKIKLL